MADTEKDLTDTNKHGSRPKVTGWIITIIGIVFLMAAATVITQARQGPFYTAKYSADSTQCVHDATRLVCTIMVTIANNNDREFYPDFTGTVGPGWVDSDVWGVYVVTSKGEKLQGHIDFITIQPHATVKVPATVELSPDARPKEILIFDHSITLDSDNATITRSQQ